MCATASRARSLAIAAARASRAALSRLRSSFRRRVAESRTIRLASSTCRKLPPGPHRGSLRNLSAAAARASGTSAPIRCLPPALSVGGPWPGSRQLAGSPRAATNRPALQAVARPRRHRFRALTKQAGPRHPGAMPRERAAEASRPNRWGGTNDRIRMARGRRARVRPGGRRLGLVARSPPMISRQCRGGQSRARSRRASPAAPRPASFGHTGFRIPSTISAFFNLSRMVRGSRDSLDDLRFSQVLGNYGTGHWVALRGPPLRAHARTLAAGRRGCERHLANGVPANGKPTSPYPAWGVASLAPVPRHPACRFGRGLHARA